MKNDGAYVNVEELKHRICENVYSIEELTGRPDDGMIMDLVDIIRTVDECTRYNIDDTKQIPKEPDYEGDGYDDNGNLIYDIWICPTCFKRYELDYEEYSFCPNCGQKIDWSDKKE